MNKKILKIVLIVLILLIIGLCIREIILNSDGKLERTSTLSREEIIQLLEKGANNNNYSFSKESSAEKLETKYYVKDNMVSCYVDNELSSLINYNTNEVIRILGDKKAQIINNVNLMENSQHGYDYSLVVDNQNYDYEYIGEKDENDRKVIIIKIYHKGTNAYTKFYIDKETGLILSKNTITKFLFISYSIDKSSRKIEVGVVTDEDIKMPDLVGYEII